jgi:hypothetical protein
MRTEHVASARRPGRAGLALLAAIMAWPTHAVCDQITAHSYAETTGSPEWANTGYPGLGSGPYYPVVFSADVGVACYDPTVNSTETGFTYTSSSWFDLVSTFDGQEYVTVVQSSYGVAYPNNLAAGPTVSKSSNQYFISADVPEVQCISGAVGWFVYVNVIWYCWVQDYQAQAVGG